VKSRKIFLFFVALAVAAGTLAAGTFFARDLVSRLLALSDAATDLLLIIALLVTIVLASMAATAGAKRTPPI